MNRRDWSSVHELLAKIRTVRTVSSRAPPLNNGGTRFVVLPFEILIGQNVLTMSKVDPVIHTEYLCSGGATTWIAIVCGASHQVFRHVLTSPDLLKLAFASC